MSEGLEVPWGDTLCKRALDEGLSCTTDVPAVWGDSQAAIGLGIVTYVSVPVRLNDGRLWGTLYAADVPHAQAAEQLPTLRLFARLIADEFVVGAGLPRGTVVSLETRVRRAGRFVFRSDDAEVEVRCSTGIASSDACLDADGLLRSSDAAMYRDKPVARIAEDLQIC